MIINDATYTSCNASGLWGETNARYNVKVEELEGCDVVQCSLVHTHTMMEDCGLTLFQDPNQALSGPQHVPSEVTDRYWVQAEVPVVLMPRFEEITEKSGKFLVFCHLSGARCGFGFFSFPDANLLCCKGLWYLLLL